MLLAATPTWFAENVVAIAVITLAVLTIAVVRMVQKLTVRLVLLGLIAVVAVFVYANRLALETCAETCKCELGGQDVTLPACGADLTP